jgi:epoxyqueuosine reductase
VREGPSFGFFGRAYLPPEVRTVIVLALEHPETAPHRDWWDGGGGTPGNRELIRIANGMGNRLKDDYGIEANVLPYHPQRGGIFLKDAAATAGVGVVGANNLLVTRQYGPRVRLYALTTQLDLPPSPPLDFDPCRTCRKPCLSACPENAFADGSYRRSACSTQMNRDVRNAERAAKHEAAGWSEPIRYCRACELACPVGG